MKNQFNKITQSIFEAFKGPRTKDYEYDKMEQEYQICKERILNLKSTIENYPNKLEGYKTFIEELILITEIIFEGEQGMYSKYMSDVTNAHKALNEKLINMFTRVSSLKEMMEKWTKNSSTVDEKIKLREEKRKTFDHYDEKMSDLYEERQKIIAKGNEPDEKDEERFMRNIKKYQDAAKDYIEATNDAYKFICYFIDSKYENISIGIAEFLDMELTFFIEANQIFNYFRNIRNNVLTIKQSFRPPNRKYDASNYIRGKTLLNISVEEMKKSKTIISGVIEGNPEYSKNNDNNGLNRSNTHQNQSNFINNQNNFNSHNNYSNFNNNNNNQTILLNPYNNSSSNQPFSSYNYYKLNIDNSIPDPFGTNKTNLNSNNPFINKDNKPSQPKNPYDAGSNFSGENPFDKPNI